MEEIFEKENQEIEKEEKNKKLFEGKKVFKIENGNLKPSSKKEYYKNDYLLIFENILIIDKDKRDIRPYVRFLFQNNYEKRKYLFIVFILVFCFFIFLFQLLILALLPDVPDYSDNFSKIEKLLNEKNNIQIIDTTPTIINSNTENLINKK